MIRNRTNKPYRATRRRLPWFLILLLRVVAIVLSVQTSGVAHVGADLAGSVFGYVVEHEDCSRETDEKCPPGCPNCHCAHGGASALPPVATVLHVPRLRGDSSWSSRPHATTAPPAPPLSSVYRPPKPIDRLFG